MMEIIEFFFSGPQWLVHFLCLLVLFYAISPTIEKHYYFNGKEADFGGGADTGGREETSTSEDGSKVSKE